MRKEDNKMSKIIDVKDLCKTYVINKRQNNVLKNINFSIEDGEMVAIMGPSGSGKSTLLYTVSGMDDATCVQLFLRDLNHELTHIYLKDENLLEFFKTVEIRDLEGIKTYIKENTQSIVVHFNPDALTTFEYQQVFASDYDVWFTKDPYIVRFMRNNMKLNAILYQEAFNPRLHPKPNITKAEAEKESGIDICTYGTIYPYRSRMLNQIIQAGLNITIYGTKPNRFYDSKLDKAFTNKYITGKEKAKVLYGSKIVFNQMHYAEIESMNNRFFEANGCGAFQLVDYRPILHEILPISPELVSFKSIDEGIEKIKYYLGKSQERHEIASKIYNHFINHFSYDHLIKHILSNI